MFETSATALRGTTGILGGRKLGFMHRKVGKIQIDGGPSFRALFLGQHKTPPFLVVATDMRWGDGKTRKLAPQIQLFSWTGGDSSPQKNVFWAVKFSGDQAIKRAMKTAKM